MTFTFARQACAMLIALTASLFALPIDVQAQEETTPVLSSPYPIDLWIEDCGGNVKQGFHAALAVSKVGVRECVTNRSERNAKNKAKGACKSLVPQKIRKKAPCEIVATDAEILEPHLVSLLQQEVSLPVDVKIYDGDTEKIQTIKAKVVYGEAITMDKRRMRVVHEAGATICDGAYRLSRRKVYFDLTCFNQYRFRDQVTKAERWFLFNGVYAPTFPVKLERNASYIEIIPPPPT